MDLKTVLREKELKIETLEYDNYVIKDILEKEKDSTKICLECEEMKDQVFSSSSKSSHAFKIILDKICCRS